LATIKKEYKNKDITVVWQPDLCFHSENCIKGSPKVFDMNRRPWIELSGDSTDKIIETVKKCPSGALSYYQNDAADNGDTSVGKVEITIATDGPLLVKGEIKLVDGNGNQVETSDKSALCRCGGSNKKPFCDGTHNSIGFKG